MKTTLAVLTVSAVLLAACSRGDDAAVPPAPLITDKFASQHFLQYLNHQPSLAAGDYTLVVAPVGAPTGSYQITYTGDDGSTTNAPGSWTNLASSDPTDPDDPQHALTLALPGGLAADFTSSAAACLYLLDRGNNILARAGDADATTAVCDTGAMSGNFDLPHSRTNDPGYASAYYATIDGGDTRDTLEHFKQANAFDDTNDVHVIFRDTRDLGYGRDMHFHDGGAGTVCHTYAFYVNNFVVDDVPGLPYGPLNLDAAIQQVERYHIGTNAIEYGPIDADGVGGADDINGDGTVDAADCFPRFYNFDPATHQRRLTVDLDGKGDKAMPVPCIVCHGGRADALAPSAVNGNALSKFPRSGDTFAHLQPLDVGTFEYGDAAPWRRADLEPGLKTINAAVYDSYEVLDSRAPSWSYFAQWDSSMARELLESWYGGSGLPGAFDDSYVPAGWVPDPNTGDPPAGADTLYHSVLANNCRTCHLMRGLPYGNGSDDINFTSWDKFIGYADRIEPLVFDEGIMPLATLTFDNFYDTPALPQLLGSFLPNFSHVASDGSLLLPGRPVARAGPDRTSTSPVSVSGVASVFATSYQWSIESMPTGAVATLSNASTVRPTLTASLDGQYTLQLVVSDGTQASDPDTVVVTIDSSMSPAPSALTFTTDIKPVLTSAGCTGCHFPGGGPPVYYVDPGVGDNWDVYTTVRSLVNFEDPEQSRLLRKPSDHHHGGGLRPGFDLAGTHDNYDLFLNWILEGAREN